MTGALAAKRGAVLKVVLAQRVECLRVAAVGEAGAAAHLARLQA